MKISLHELAHILLKLPNDPEIGMDLNVLEKNDEAPPDCPEIMVELKVDFCLATAAEGDKLAQMFRDRGISDTVGAKH